MSASNEKKQHQSEAGLASDPKTAREAQQRKEERRSNMVYAAIAIVFVIVAVISLTWKSNVIQKNATAVSINGESYNAAEVDFHFQEVYRSFLSQNSYYLSYLGLDTNTDLRDQQFGEDQTWFDYFLDQALQQMVTVQALNEAAAAEEYNWTDAMQTQLDDSLSALKTNVLSYGYPSFSQYLTAVYGASMTEKIYTEQVKASILAQNYATAYSDSLTYTTDDLTATYTAAPNMYDKVSYDGVRVNGSVPTKDADGNAVEVTDEMKSDAMTAAKATADEIYASWKSGKSFSDLAETSENATISSSESNSYTESVLGDWLFDSARKSGDSAVLEDADSSAYYVVTFRDRYRENYNTVNIRHILLKTDDSALDPESETYEADLKALNDATKAKAEELLAQWKAGEATEDSFAQLATEKSEDTGSAANGGLYQQIYQGQTVPEFNDWCFDSARKSGDTGIVYGDSGSYKGYHIMYFVGTDLPYWQVRVTSDLKNSAVSAWYEEKTADYTAEQHSFGMRFVG